MELILDSALDALMDCAKLLPFLFLTYLLMEWIEHKTEEKQKHYVETSGAFGPLVGGALGVVPQCGFSCVASNLYSGGVITAGVLLAVFLSTSDEMLPIFISHTVNAGTIIKILLTKVLVAVITGYAVDFANKHIRKPYLKKKYGSNKADISEITEISEREKTTDEKNIEGHAHHHSEDGNNHGHEHHHSGDGEKHIHDLCEQEHCNCEDGIWLSALKHTIKIAIFIVIVSFILNILIEAIGEESIKNFLSDIPVLGEMLAALVGLIPNCAASVIISELYLDGMLSAGAMMSGLLVSAGVGLLVLFRMNRHRLKENIRIVATLYVSGVFWGILINLFGITF